jgi:hypothetical protein
MKGEIKMKKILMVLIFIISFCFITGCNNEESIKTYDDIDFIEKQQQEEEKEEEVEEDFEEEYETLEYRQLSDYDIGVMFTLIEEEGNYYLHIVASKFDSDDIVWEYKTSQYEISMHKIGQYVSDPKSDETIYILETDYVTALDLVTGKVLWQNKEKCADDLNDGIVINDTLYAKIPWENKIYAFNKKTGKKIKELSLPESEEYEQYNIVGSYNNNIIIQCMAENSEFIQLNPNNNSISTMNIYLTD